METAILELEVTMCRATRTVQIIMCSLIALFIVGFLAANSQASSDLKLTKGQTVYVPVYSHIYTRYYRDEMIHRDVVTNVSIRNTDPAYSITVVSADVYDSNGELVKNYLPKALQLNPLASTNLLIQTSDLNGSGGVSLILKWRSENFVNEPIVESIILGSCGTHAASFASHGQVIQELSE